MSYAHLSRRNALRVVGGTALASGLGYPLSLMAGEKVTAINYGFVLGIHCAPTRGLLEECPQFGVDVQMQRFQKGRDIVQTVIGGRGDVAVTGPISVLRSIQAGNDLTIFGNYYLHTSLVVVTNTDKIKGWADFTKPDVTVGINSQGDITQVMMVGGLLKNKFDAKGVKWADIGGSGSRMRALIAKRIQASVIHFDQVPKVQKSGNYNVLLVPAQEYDPWVNEVVYARTDWLKKPGNRKKAVGVMKGIITAHRKATQDYGYYKEAFLKYATLKGKKKMSDDQIKSYWNTIAKDMGVWPKDNGFKRSNFEKLMPYYVASKAVDNKPIDLNKAVDDSIVADALKELG
ncbi:MAG: ABC transporter substrate-binding protein [Alphaproteobacteria bacterium]|nr:ABC transporter substrate-binding protein [Alphaproteobacteria bacterium]